MDADPAELVRSGYNAISRAYRGDDGPAHQYGPWLAGLLERIPGQGQVLDIGCGCGVPVARRLAAAGHQVTGVDISDVQVERARRLVPGAVFLRADATDLDFSPGSFDAVVCLYALIHMPLDRQPLLLRGIARWLRPGGWLLAVTGQDAWTGTEDNWLGGTAPMCGGARPTPPPTGPGSPRPAWRSPASSSCRKETAATRCSGHRPRKKHVRKLLPISSGL